MSSLRVKNVMATFAVVAAFSFSLPASPAWAAPLTSSTNQYVITTIAGNGISGSSGDGGPATQAELAGPGKIALGPDGSLYIADTYGHRIRKVDPDGIITTVAGIGSIGFSGDGGPAIQAELNYPDGVAVAPDGVFYISDHNQRVRAVGLDGIITTIAGNGIGGFGGDGGPALDAQFDYPDALAIGPDGSIYVSDHFNSRIRRIAPNGIITTVAGNGTEGFSGDGGPATDAQLIVPGDIAVAPDGSLYIPDYGNQRIRHVDLNGIITTIAGNGNAGYSGDGGPATQAEFSNPSSIAIGTDGSVFIGDESRHVRQVAPDGIITTIAGNGTGDFGADGIPATQAGFVVAAVITGPNGTLYLSDGLNVRIRLLTPAPNLPIFADGFESGNFSQWSNYSSDHGDLKVSAAAALVGAKGLQATINDNTPIGMRDEKPAAESHYRARFYFDPNSLAMAENDWHVIFFGYSGSGTTTPVLRVDLLYINGSYAVRPSFLDDGVTWRQSGRIPISDAAHYLEVEWQAATTPGANDGSLNFWVDGVQRSHITGMDNDTRRIERVRLGAIAGIDPNTIGADFFDAFESRRSDYIGADPNGPVVVASSANVGDITAWTATSELTDPEEAKLMSEVRQEARNADQDTGPYLYLPSVAR